MTKQGHRDKENYAGIHRQRAKAPPVSEGGRGNVS